MCYKNNNKIEELRDICRKLCEHTDSFEPIEIEQFAFDDGYYTAKLRYNIQPDPDDLALLEDRRQNLQLIEGE